MEETINNEKTVDNNEMEQELIQNNEEVEKAEETTTEEVVSENRNDIEVSEQTPQQNETPEEQEQDIEEMVSEMTEDNNQEDDSEEEEEDDSDGNDEKIDVDIEAISQKSEEEILESLENLINEHSPQQIKEYVSEIRNLLNKRFKEREKDLLKKFMEEGGEKDDFKPEENEYRKKLSELVKKYSDKRKEIIQRNEKQKEDNLKIKQELLEQLKELIESSEPLKDIHDKYTIIKERWDSTGQVPQRDVNNVWNNYHFYVEKFFEKVNMYRELKDLDLKRNLELKNELCEQAEDLLMEKSITKSFKLLQDYHEKWREIGPVPRDKKDEVWERFKSISDQINDRRREYYEQMHAQFEENYQAKLVLCTNVEEISAQEHNNIKEWNESSKKLEEILKSWKSIGRAPREVNEQVWERFKGQMDIFFANKKAYLQKLKEEQLENYNKKLNICIQAEAIANRDDWRKATSDILNLQKEWKEIGTVSRRQSEAIWKRFRAACDLFFERKSHYFANIKTIEKENLDKKKELIQQVIDFEYSESRNDDFEKLKDFQRQWNEIGHVPYNEKEKIYQEFRKALNVHYDKLKISAQELRKTNYQSKIDNILDSPDANKAIDREKRFLTNKANKIKEDIKLWENNIGFFVKSANAELLTAEFKKKIDNAHKELEEIDVKLKLLTQNK